MKTYPSNNKRKIRKEEAHRPSLLRYAIFPKFGTRTVKARQTDLILNPQPKLSRSWTFRCVRGFAVLLVSIAPLMAFSNVLPVLVGLSNTTFPENLNPGTVVADLNATDPDANATLSFSLVSGVGSDDNDKFTVAANTLRTKAPFDHEATPNLSVRIQVKDDKNATDQKVFALNVADVDEPPVILNRSSLPVGLLRSWTFDEDYRDIILKDEPISKSGNLTFGEDRFGKAKGALRIIGGEVRYPREDLPYGNQPRTMTAWLRNENSSGLAWIARWGRFYSNQGWGLMVLGNCWTGYNHGADTRSSIAIKANGDWLHLAFVHDGNAQKQYVFIDGQLKGTKENYSHQLSQNDPFIVGHSGYRGLIDDLRVYDRALSADEVVQDKTNSFITFSLDEDNIFQDLTANDLNASDPEEAGPLTWSVAEAPAKGVLEVNGTGLSPTIFRYTPEADFHGMDSFAVRVTDATGKTSLVRGSFEVQPVADPSPPVLEGSDEIVVGVNADWFPRIPNWPLLRASDPVEDILVWRVVEAPRFGEMVLLRSVGNEPSFTYRPNKGFAGDDSVVLGVSDGLTERLQTLVFQVRPGDHVIDFAKSFGGTSSDYPRGIAAHPDDGAYLTGQFHSSSKFGGVSLDGNGSSSDIFLSLVGNDGNVRWARSFGSNRSEYAESISVASNGGVFIAGRTNSPSFAFETDTGESIDIDTNGSSYNALLLHYDANGSLLWGKTFGGTANDGATAVASLPNGGSVLAGYFREEVNFGALSVEANGSSDDAFLTRLDSNGNPVWACRWGGTGYDRIESLSVTEDSIFAVGYFERQIRLGDFVLDSNSSSRDAFVARFSHDGSLVWIRSVGGKYSDYGHAVASSTAGDVYVAGRFRNDLLVDGHALDANGSSEDAFLLRMDANGSVTWVRGYGGAGNENFNEITLMPDGVVAVGGYFNGTSKIGDQILVSNGGNDACVVLVDANGSHLSTSSFGGSSSEQLFGLASDQDGSLFALAQCYGEMKLGTLDINSSAGADLFLFRLRNSSKNSPPSNLVLSQLDFFENQPVGTLIGPFTTTDPDDPNATMLYTYSLVDGNGSQHNTSFSIDANDTLRTVAILDREANATLSVRVRVYDEHNASFDKVFFISVNNIDDAPVVTNALSDLSANENPEAPAIDLADLFNDVDDDNAAITKTATSSNASLVTATVNGNVLTLDYQANQSGTATITVTGTSNGQTVSDVFTVTVSPVDDAPVVANGLADLNATEDAADATIALGNVFNDIDDDNASITKDATSSNASLVTAAVNGNVLTLAYQANQSGTATITVTGTSNGQTVSDVFTVTVSPVDDAPVVANARADLSAAEDAADATIDLGNLFNDIDDANGSITKAATSSDTSLVTATVNGNTLTLAYQANQSGTATITVTGTSNGQSVSDAFDVTVSPVDDAPVVSNAIADLSAAEDAADATIALANLFNDIDDANASITKAATSSNASLVTATVSGNVLTLDYQANQSGTATITVTGTSNGQAVSDVFTVTVSAVDDAPVVANALADLSAAEDAAEATIDLANLFNDIDDDNASITNTATSSDASLVTAAVNGNVLTLAYQANQSGTATITVTGTSNGQAVSDAFDVTVSPVNDAPVVVNAISDLSAAEDAADVTIDLANLFNDVDDANASITKVATSSNASLVTATVNGNTLTLDYQANQSGSATIIVTATSNGQAVSDAFDITVDPVNDAPENLALSGNQIRENKPAGTIVGNFSATDIDANATLAYFLVDGNGSTDNARFTLANGTLKTAGSLDFEAGSSLSIRVRVTDNDDASSETAFAISVTNVVEDLDGDAIEDAFDTDDDGDGFSDAQEVAYGSDPMDAASVANQAPNGIALDNSQIIENSPTGTKIGDFLVSDPDDTNGSGAYVVALVDGNGSTDNNSFAVGTDGSLRTAAVLDFETNIEHSIRVRVSDEHNASLEAVLEISATNSFAPIVRTLPPTANGNGIITLWGTVLSDGNTPVTEVGVLTSDNLRFEDAVSLAATQSANFSVQASSLLAGSRYYVRAFAANAEGTTFGAIKRFYTQDAASTPVPWWNDANASAGGWRESDWFGTFIPYDNGWLYHVDFGWLYIVQDGTSGLWAWKKNSGWHWTAPGVFPHLYRNDTKQWLYFLSSKEGQPYFYNHATGSVE